MILNITHKMLFPGFNSPSHQPQLSRRQSIIQSSTNIIKPMPELCKLETIKDTRNTLLLTLTNATNPKDHHLLNPSLIYSIRDRLHEAKSRATEGSVLIMAAEGEYFSGGFDYRHAQEGGSEEDRKARFLEMIDLFKPLVADLISLPMPTIAAINGYATGAGLMLAISHDYLTMAPEIHSLHSSHLSEGMSLPPYFAALLRSKVNSPSNLGRLVLRDLKFCPTGAKEIGVLCTPSYEVKDDAVKMAEKLAEDLSKKKWNGEVYAELRKALHPELCKELGLTCTTILPKL